MELERPDFNPSDDEYGDGKKKSKRSKKSRLPLLGAATGSDTKKSKPEKQEKKEDKKSQPQEKSNEQEAVKDKINDEATDGYIVEAEKESDEKADTHDESDIEIADFYPKGEVILSLEEVDVEHEILLRPEGRVIKSHVGAESPTSELIETSHEGSVPLIQESELLAASVTEDANNLTHGITDNKPVFYEDTYNNQISSNQEFERLAAVSVSEGSGGQYYESTTVVSTQFPSPNNQVRNGSTDQALWTERERLVQSTGVNPNLPITETQDRNANPVIQTETRRPDTSIDPQLRKALRSERAYSRHYEQKLNEEANNTSEDLKLMQKEEAQNIVKLEEIQEENKVLTNQLSLEIEKFRKINKENKPIDVHINAPVQVEQLEPRDEQVRLPEDHRVEQSAWHRIEVDTKTGRVVEAPTIAYGHEFKHEQGKERWVEDNEPVTSASGQLAVGTITDLGASLAKPAASKNTSSNLEIPVLPKSSPMAQAQQLFGNATDSILWAIFILILFAIAAVAIL